MASHLRARIRDKNFAALLPVWDMVFGTYYMPKDKRPTVLERALEHLGDLRLAGFLSLELREHGQRVGFEAVGLGGRRAILAHVRFRSPVSVGRYGVEPDRLTPLIEEELLRPPGTVEAYLIDEIGKMECLCPQFITSMGKLLGAPVPLVATIALRGGGFIAEVKKRPDVRIVECILRTHVDDAVDLSPPISRVELGEEIERLRHLQSAQ